MIRILDDLTINKIAAGEVVEGPFSVVKELIENAIDAEANSITLEIKEGGKKLIRITDNGIGIPEGEVQRAFQRHATSKISRLEDLESNLSLGFRGEALASIAAVSQLEIITRPHHQEHGICLEIAGGNIVGSRQVGCPVGTTILVKNLFYNTPVRMKFMKSTQGETLKISEIITRLALSRPDIAFRYVNNNNVMLTTVGDSDLSKTILSILDKEIYNNLLPIAASEGGMSVQGYIGQAVLARGNRSYEITYINSRYVKNKLLYNSIEAAYKEKLPINKYPLCILNLEVPPNTIDVNVHPTKTEVKFKNEDEIKEFLLKSIANALRSGMTIPKIAMSVNPTSVNKPLASVAKTEAASPASRPTEMKIQTEVFERADAIEPPNDKGLALENKSIYTTDNTQQENKQLPLFDEIIKDIEARITSPSSSRPEKAPEEIQNDFLNSLMIDFKIIGQLFNTYILLEKDTNLYLIDQHAAHERLIYQQLMKEQEESSVVTQTLLAPQVISLINEDYLILMENIDNFRRFGFEIEAFGQNTVILRSVPLVIGRPASSSFIVEIIDEIRSNQLEGVAIKEAIILRSCKQAIKASDSLDTLEIKQLLQQLSTTKSPLTCPHGRPIVLSLTKYEIEKFFKRIQ